LRGLKEALGIDLFRRKAHGLDITEDREAALTHDRDLLRMVKLMTETFKCHHKIQRKTIQVGFIPAALTGFLANGKRLFNSENPDTCVQIRKMSPRQQEKALVESEINLALLDTACPEVKRRFEHVDLLDSNVRCPPQPPLLRVKKVNQSVGIGEHSDIVEAIQKELDTMAQAEDRIDMITKHFS